ncbi:MAG: protein of unknown function (DUF4405) [Candidatus Kentron sp. G]|nr:MAG: protein of unknown function (DUF4405) [Candidatus Kentron sp. G]
MRYFLPHGRGRSGAIWTLDRHQWGDLHFWIALVLLAILAFHLFLHWRWIVSMVAGAPRKRSGWRALFGAAGLIGFLALAFLPIMSGVDEVRRVDKLWVDKAQGAGSRAGMKSKSELEIRGPMTLQEVEDLTGFPVPDLLQHLGLPRNISPDSRLGQLRRTYGFSMEEVRETVGKAGRE